MPAMQQMTGGAANVVFGRCHPDSLHPDLDWLAEQLRQPSPPKMVVLVNPNNPTGASKAATPHAVKPWFDSACNVQA